MSKKKKKKSSSSKSSQLSDIKKKAESIQKELNKSIKSGEIKSSSSSKSSSSQLTSLQKELAAKQAELAAKQKEEAAAKANGNTTQLASLQKELALKQAELAKVQAEEATAKKEEPAKTKEEPAKEQYDSSVLTNSAEFKALSKDDQEAVLAVFDAVSSNDQVKAKRLAETFKAMSKTNDVYFGQQLRLAQDAIERGYVEIDKEAEFKALQAQKRLEDLRKDYATKKDFMSLEEASVMKDIERDYQTNLEDLQTGLAESGFTSSSRRVQKEKILEEATGGLRESKQRAFAFDRSALEDTLGRGERDTQAELNRLSELTKAGKLDFLRKAESQVGTENLPTLVGAEAPLGGVYGEIPEKKLQDTLSAMQGLVF